jgi:competence protein ComEA
MLRTSMCLVALLAVLAAPASAQTKPPASRAAAAHATGQVVNLNTASQAELEQLPGIGPKVASRIVDYRAKKGPFHKIEEVMNVQGIGEKSFLKLRAQLTVSGNAAQPQAPAPQQ